MNDPVPVGLTKAPVKLPGGGNSPVGNQTGGALAMKPSVSVWRFSSRTGAAATRPSKPAKTTKRIMTSGV